MFPNHAQGGDPSQRELETYGEVFNVGTGEGTEIQTIADLVSDYQITIPARQINGNSVDNNLETLVNCSKNILNKIKKLWC